MGRGSKRRTKHLHALLRRTRTASGAKMAGTKQAVWGEEGGKEEENKSEKRKKLKLRRRQGRTALQKGMRRPTNKNAVLGWLKNVLDVGKAFSRREERCWLDILNNIIRPFYGDRGKGPRAHRHGWGPGSDDC
ncbi:hypothetical protein TEQG_00115 [Trichophyton equinum CBS 127.97]|uniref:Uncharacterized protein n=1 Tax=Trichophyton equinum (strain ATCC MYA-4606 / CBS 127.97) TaxID=559882 RepID=F2PGP3_TRIEC|nr:hypothetical protein TEQG_00115 [Trichophyton equinum CBS 127.97]